MSNAKKENSIVPSTNNHKDKVIISKNKLGIDGDTYFARRVAQTRSLHF